jgi:glycerol-3-phosphate dehydrogenase
VVLAARREFARTVDDVLSRRLHLATETADHGEAARPAVARWLASVTASPP